MSSYLSQAVANLVAAEHEVKALSGLPTEAQQIQTELSVTISLMISQIQTMQTAVSSFVQIAIPELNNIEKMVSGNQPLPNIKAAVANVQSEASTLKSSVVEVSTQLKQVSSQAFGYFNQLHTIGSSLTAQIVTLQSQLGNAQSAQKAAKKKYYYLIALGPFGLVGLSVALGLYLKWRSEVNDYESQIRSLSTQINLFSAMKLTCQLLVTDLQEVVTQTSGIKNSVDFLISDILAISSDLDLGSGSAAFLSVIDMKVKAAIAEVTTLGVSASSDDEEVASLFQAVSSAAATVAAATVSLLKIGSAAPADEKVMQVTAPQPRLLSASPPVSSGELQMAEVASFQQTSASFIEDNADSLNLTEAAQTNP